MQAAVDGADLVWIGGDLPQAGNPPFTRRPQF